MSGTPNFPVDPLPSQNFPIYPVNIDRLPRLAEGSKSLFVPISWIQVFNAVTPGSPTLPTRLIASLNLLSQYNTGQFTTVQAIYIDNSTCCYPITVVSLETGQQINVNPFTRGMYPIFASVAPAFIITLEFFQTPNYLQAYGNQNLGTTRVTFLNTPQKYFESTYTGTPLNYNFSGQATVASTPVLFTDNIGTFGNGLQFVDGNTLKRIQQIYVTLFPTTAFAAITSVPLAFFEISPTLGNIIHWQVQFAAPVGQVSQVFAIG